jgi:serine/threonine protein kinase
MMTGNSPLDSLGKDNNQIMKQVALGGIQVPLPKASHKIHSFLTSCLSSNSFERLMIQDLMKHEFISGKKFSYDYGDDSVKASLSRTADCHNAIPEADSE